MTTTGTDHDPYTLAERLREQYGETAMKLAGRRILGDAVFESVQAERKEMPCPSK